MIFLRNFPFFLTKKKTTRLQHVGILLNVLKAGGRSKLSRNKTLLYRSSLKYHWPISAQWKTSESSTLQSLQLKTARKDVFIYKHHLYYTVVF